MRCASPLSFMTVFCCLPVCLFACLPACLLVCLSACLLVCLSACLLVCLSACLLVCLSACLSTITLSVLTAPGCQERSLRQRINHRRDMCE
ncbi:hypothetical protein CMR03_07550 [Pantoea allii]|nr:hypothetical protein CMR03_07550 [Pantoea allii]